MIASSLALIFTHPLHPLAFTTCYVLSRACQECSGVIHPSSMKSVIFLPLSPCVPSSLYCIASCMWYEEEIYGCYRIGCNLVGFVLLLFNSSYVLTRKSFTCSPSLTFVPVLVLTLNGKIQKHLISSAIFSFHRQGIVSYFCKMHT